MTVAPSMQKISAADLLSMQDGEHFELVDGELVERDRSAEASWVAGEVFVHLSNWCAEDQNRGYSFPSQGGYQCFFWDEDRVRKPDASFIAKQRLPDGPLPEGHCHIAPDLAVEVVSPHDLYYEVERKVLDYLRAGVQVVWVVTPATRTVMIHRSADASPQHLSEASEISGDPILPGFRARVADFFPPRQAESKTVAST